MSEHTTRTLFLAAASALVLAACYGPADTTVYEPGVYKGADDPLLAKTAKDEHKAMLRERLQRVQTDR